jgi:ferredoxin
VNRDRRFFFRDAAASVIRPIAELLADRLGGAPREPVLRPPGAIHEELFNDTCQRCGECVKACPAKAIFPLGPIYGDAAGTPAIDPSRAACVVCDGLQCTQVCPSGALLRVYDPTLIRMGLAEVYTSLCVRARAEPCTECVDRCPLGKTAIHFPDDGPPEVLDGCVGCGVCEQYCPTSPKAIVVRPGRG